MPHTQTLEANASSSKQCRDILGCEDWSATLTVPGTDGNWNVAFSIEASTSPFERTAVALLFSAIFLVGLLGNCSVMRVIMSDRKMRQIVMNRYVLNIAVADTIMNCLGVPEFVMFFYNRGWTLGETFCKANRYLLVTLVYVTVISLTVVCVERYVAVVHPVRAHLLLSSRRVPYIITVIWLIAFASASPVGIFVKLHDRFANDEQRGYCVLDFEDRALDRRVSYYNAYKYSESVVFYFFPLVLQGTLYTIMGVRLAADKRLSGSNRYIRVAGETKTPRHFTPPERRVAVVRMLATCLVIYMISYSPSQVLLVYSSSSGTTYKETWLFRAFTITLLFLNSSANPIVYYIFSRSFRKRLNAIYKCSPRRAADGHVLASRTPTGLTIQAASL